ncbi:MAG: hypothetical protein Q9227_000371 [Pyrenula ochraceoflavens]
MATGPQVTPAPVVRPKEVKWDYNPHTRIKTSSCDLPGGYGILSNDIIAYQKHPGRQGYPQLQVPSRHGILLILQRTCDFPSSSPKIAHAGKDHGLLPTPHLIGAREKASDVTHALYPKIIIPMCITSRLAALFEGQKISDDLHNPNAVTKTPFGSSETLVFSWTVASAIEPSDLQCLNRADPAFSYRCYFMLMPAASLETPPPGDAAGPVDD